MSSVQSTAVDQLTFLNGIPVECNPFAADATIIVRPTLAGRKVRVRGKTDIYVIDCDGFRRLVPFPLTFLNLFKDRAAIHDVLVADSIATIAEGPALDDGAILVRGAGSEGIFLLDKRRKHLIGGPQVMARYDFDEQNVVVVPQIVLDSIPAGEDWR
jgi:hypothetical protein